MKLTICHSAVLLLGCAIPAAAQQIPVKDPLPFGSGAVAVSELSAITGRSDTAQEIRAQNTSNVSHNSVTGQSQTGAISFDAGAFQAMTGLSLLSANTGNNVSINSSLNVNVSILPR
jgi:hypothetical protein